MASPKVRPLGDKVLVKPCDEEDTLGWRHRSPGLS